MQIKAVLPHSQPRLLYHWRSPVVVHDVPDDPVGIGWRHFTELGLDVPDAGDATFGLFVVGVGLDDTGACQLSVRLHVPDQVWKFVKWQTR